MTENHEYPIHSAAALFPLLEGEELQALADDIKHHGLIEPILLHDGMIIDGRNRLAACKLAGVEPRFEAAHVNGGTPTELIVSRNIHRRHLTASERGAIGALIVPMLAEEAKERQRIGQSHGGAAPRRRGRPRKIVQNSAQSPDAAVSSTVILSLSTQHGDEAGRANVVAAKAVGVSKNTVQRARAVMKADPAEFERIQQGKTTVNEAYAKVIKKEVSTGKRRLMLEGAAKKRLVRVLSFARGLCHEMPTFDVSLVTSMPADEIKQWADDAWEAAKHLRGLATRLRSLL